jgi:phage shock protein C
MIDGVCGGIARYFSIDPTLIRISWVLLALLGGAGIILYIAAMILIPAEKRPEDAAGQQNPSATSNHRFWGFLLIGVGLFWFAHTMGLHLWPSVWAFPWDITFPVLLILAGVAFLFGGRNYLTEPSEPNPESAPAEGVETDTLTPRSRLFRSRREKKIFGVCGGIGIHLDIDPVLIRLLFVLAAVASVWFAVLAYCVLAIVMTKEPEVSATT